MEVDKGFDQISDIQPFRMAAHARLNNEFTEDEKCHNPMSWLIHVYENYDSDVENNPVIRQHAELVFETRKHLRAKVTLRFQRKYSKMGENGIGIDKRNISLFLYTCISINC